VTQGALEDQLHLIRASQIEVLADDFFKEDPAVDGAIEHLGEGELRLQDRELITVAGPTILSGEGVRQALEPFAQQRIDLPGTEGVGKALQSLRVLARENAVVQGLEGQAPLGQLALKELVPIDAELGVVGEVGTELQEERTEVLVHAVAVVMIDHARGGDDPGVRLSSLGMAATLGAKHRGFLLRLADEQQPLASLEARQILPGHIVFALTFLEANQRDVGIPGELLKPDDEILADRFHQRRGGKGVPAVKAEEAHDAFVVLQLRHVNVEVHAVNALQLKLHVRTKDFGNRMRYSHVGLRSSSVLLDHLPPRRSNTWERSYRHPCSTGARHRPQHQRTTIQLVGLRRSLVSTSAPSLPTMPAYVCQSLDPLGRSGLSEAAAEDEREAAEKDTSRAVAEPENLGLSRGTPRRGHACIAQPAPQGAAIHDFGRCRVPGREHGRRGSGPTPDVRECRVWVVSER
jgi:hypothetical protein